jgi:predicted nucleic acid-binding protein
VTKLVVDASVAAKWCLPVVQEPLHDQAIRLLHRFGSGEVRILVPDLFWAELGNFLWKAVRHRRITIADARLALREMQAREFPSVASILLLDQAFMIATTYDRTVDDCLYVALAVEAKAALITADERLANALAAHLPVKWLGAL